MDGKISVVIHTYNSEKFIRDCLESVKNFDEIVICDMYSTDKTVEIANEYNCKVVYHELKGWAEPARNFAISQATNDWILVVDSDETITEELRKYLYEFIKNPTHNTAIRIPRLNYCWGEPLEILYPDGIIRFMKKDCVDWPPTVHSTPTITNGTTYNIDAKRRELAIRHNFTDSYRAYLNTLNKYTDLEVEKLVAQNKKFSYVGIAWKSFWLIIEKYLLKGGYKNGFKGFIIAATAGFYKFTAYVKYFEYLEKQNNNK